MITDWFGEWLSRPVRCLGIRLVIEEMSEGAESVGVGGFHVTANPPCGVLPVREFGGPDHIGIEFERETVVISLRCDPISEKTWVRRARIEARLDGAAEWQTFFPSRLIDSRHRQPCVWPQTIETLESRFLPDGRGTEWANTFYHDYLLRTVEPCGPRSKYPDWLAPQYILAAAAPPIPGYSYTFNPGDSGCFDALIAAIFQPRFMIESQKLFPELIDRFGFMPGNMSPGKDNRVFSLDYSGIIWGPSCFWDLWSWSRDREFLGWFTPAMATWSRWYLANRDRNRDGWLEPGINGCRPATPEVEKKLCDQFGDVGWAEEGFRYVGEQNRETSALMLSIFECPWDDSPVFARGRCRDLRFDPESCSVNRHFIETQLYNAGLAGFCARAFTELGDPAQAEEFLGHRHRLEGLVRDHHWDEASGFYYDRDIETGRLRTEVMHAGGFYPMIHGIPTMEQARRMVRHLLDPEKFWTSYPVPTLARQSVDYNPKHYWSGRAWPSVNFHILRGLIRYGFFDAADQLLDRWLAQIRTCFERSRKDRLTIDYSDPSFAEMDMRRIYMRDCELVVPENWNSETGEVLGSPALTWGGLWMPAVIYRNFWPDGAHHALLRPGGRLRFRQRGRWDVTVEGDRATVNGFKVVMDQSTSYRLDCRTGNAEPLALNSDIG